MTEEEIYRLRLERDKAGVAKEDAIKATYHRLGPKRWYDYIIETRPTQNTDDLEKCYTIYEIACAKHRVAYKRYNDAVKEFANSPNTESIGNRAFDEYRADILQRLEDEQRQFKVFLEGLRYAKDKEEFDAFLSQKGARHTMMKNDDIQYL